MVKKLHSPCRKKQRSNVVYASRVSYVPFIKKIICDAKKLKKNFCSRIFCFFLHGGNTKGGKQDRRDEGKEISSTSVWTDKREKGQNVGRAEGKQDRRETEQ